MSKTYSILLAGKWVESEEKLEVRNPYDGSLVGTTFSASEAQLEEAIKAGLKAFEATRRMPAYERASILRALAQGVRERKEEIARTITLESGKPIRDASFEAERGIYTLETASEEAKRIGGEMIPLDTMAPSKGRIGITRRFPIGLIAAISPFNFPLNLALHKLAPAIASGNPIILKPPSNAPLTMLTVAQIVTDLGLPQGAVSIMPTSRAIGDRLVTDERIKMLTFTGSPAVGWEMKRKAGKKKVLLELGGNAGVVVDRDANLDYAAKRLAIGSFSFAGQICISVQRIYVHEEVYRDFTERFLQAVAGLKLGDPLDPQTDLGPLIDDKAAARTVEWVREAVEEGARILTGGKARGSLFEPTVLVDTKPESKICRLEAFAPIVNLFSVRDFQEGVAQVNRSAYGLQAGVFTSSLESALYAFEELEVGGVILNDIPTYRIDHMPYGGVKDSGFGREGLKYAIEEMTEIRLLVINRI